MTDLVFAPPSDRKSAESGTQLTPRFDANGLVTAIVTDFASGKLLMVAHMNADALAKTIETGQSHFWSRSRQKLWLKGETSGTIQHVHEMRTDCDQDAIWLKVSVSGAGATCHTGMPSCFYRRIEATDGTFELIHDDIAPLFDSAEVYDNKS
ncbi:MAG: phosphoribosyl-AMP cyclohydrolase [Hyphomicrobiales bacterium]|nr:phosphoribosyl-AMP cyclohydrolase [Hyphomicrobiales bacterium]